ncbi:MAG: hypothetical protein AB7S80_16750, partial [Rhizobiaceae bacterium]
PFHPYTGFMIVGMPSYLEWSFFGIREDNRMGHWTLRYQPEKRKFITMMSGCGDQSERNTRFNVGGPVEHPDAFVPDKPMVYGRTLTDIMKARLSADDIGSCAALSLGSRP